MRLSADYVRRLASSAETESKSNKCQREYGLTVPHTPGHRTDKNLLTDEKNKALVICDYLDEPRGVCRSKNLVRSDRFVGREDKRIVLRMRNKLG